MKPGTGLPPLARGLLRLAPVQPEDREQVESDLLELLVSRRASRGRAHARLRLYRDIFSLWFVRPADIRHTTPGGEALLRDVAVDLRYAIRLFARRPAMLVLTIVGLGLGLGISTAAFTILHAAFLRGDGIEDPDRTPGILRATGRGVSTVWSYEEFLRLREGSTTAQVEAVLADRASFRTSPAFDDAPGARTTFVSGGFFQAVGGRTIMGRPLEPADVRVEGPVPLVVSHRFWTARLNADPSIIGRVFWLGPVEARIVGVMTRGFAASPNRDTQVWAPITAYGAVYGGLSGRETQPTAVEVFCRLSPGVALAEAEAQLSGVAAALQPGNLEPEDRYRARLDPGFGLGRVNASRTMSIAGFVSALIALVLLLAVANVATVLIAAAMTRDREMGVRLALGAGRGRILHQLVTEGLAFGVVSAAFAVAFTVWAVPPVTAMLNAPDGIDFAPDLTVYLFLAVATLVVGVAAGLAPAWHGRGADLLTPLKGESARADRPARRRFRSALILAQATASVVLIVLAALFVRATWRASQLDIGFDARGLYTVAVSDGYGDATGQRLREYWSRALADLASAGVGATSLVEFPPFGDAHSTSERTVGNRRVITYNNRTLPGYFRTVGLRVISGRLYTPAEAATKAPVVVVSQSLARAYWGDTSPIGDTLERVNDSNRTVIGVVSDAITARLHQGSAMAVYQPLRPDSEHVGRLIVRLSEGARVQQLREVLRSIDPAADVRITSVEEALLEEMDTPRTLATLAGFVGAVAIVLCVIGIYGLTSSIVGQRTREIGVRVALGAERSDVLRLLLWDSLRPVITGLAVGGLVAYLVGRVVAGILFGVSPADPLAFGSAAVLLVSSAGLAALLPSRRAASVDPAFVLRDS